MFGRQLIAVLMNRFPNYKTVVPACVCTFLNHRFKSLLFDAEAVQFIEEQLKVFKMFPVINVLICHKQRHN